MPISKDDKNMKILRDLIASTEANKRCCDCTAKGPVYVNATHNTFICTTCSGIHREFSHRVKSISMASFKPEEIKGLQEGGNQACNDKYLARWRASEYPEPASGDVERLRQFIRMKYIDKKWCEGGDDSKRSSGRSRGSSTQVDTPKAEPLSTILGNNIPPINVASNGSQQQNWAQFDSPPEQNWAQFDAPVERNTPFGTVGGGSVSQPQQQHHQPQTPASDLDGLLFPTTEELQRQEQEKQAKLKVEMDQKKQLDLKQQLGQMYQQQAQSQQQAAMQQMMQQMQQMQMNPQMMQQMQMNPQMWQQMMMATQGMHGGMPMQGMPAQGGFQAPANAQGQMFGSPPGANPMFGSPPGGNPMFAMQGMPGMQVQGGMQGMHVQQAPQSGAFFGMEEPQIAPVVQEPKKPDPFAALSPFAMAAKMGSGKSAAPPPTTQKQTDDLFGFGTSTTAAPSTTAPPSNGSAMDDMLSWDAPSSSVPAQQTQPTQQQQQDFNPFF